MRKPKFQTLSGVHDILPEDYKYYQIIEKTAQDILSFYNFKRIETPIFEEAELFSKGIGLATEIIQKQMYVFKTKGGETLALRPEATSGIARAYLQHGMQSLPQPVKLWCFGPFYRYERPQAGRYRQFWQLNLEVLGSGSPIIDAEVIQIFLNILKELKLKDLTVNINSIGDFQCRPYYKKLLSSYFRSRKSALCKDCRVRLKENPLRILDCKQEKCQRVKREAPQIIDHLCKECQSHFREVLEILDEMEIPYILDPYLVRGLDYYTKTVFEIFPSSFAEKENPEVKKDALVGGGRYDSLIKLLGGKDTPAVGGALGVERVIELIKKRNLKFKKEIFPPKIFLAQLGILAKRKCLKLLEEFRKEGIRVEESLGKDSLRAQLKIANNLGVKYVLILGQKEALEGEILIRNMETGKQETLKLDKIAKEVKKYLQE